MDTADNPVVQPSIEMLLYLAEFGAGPEAADEALEMDPIEVDNAMQIIPQNQQNSENIEAVLKSDQPPQPKMKANEL